MLLIYGKDCHVVYHKLCGILCRVKVRDIATISTKLQWFYFSDQAPLRDRSVAKKNIFLAAGQYISLNFHLNFFINKEHFGWQHHLIGTTRPFTRLRFVEFLVISFDSESGQNIPFVSTTSRVYILAICPHI